MGFFGNILQAGKNALGNIGHAINSGVESLTGMTASDIIGSATGVSNVNIAKENLGYQQDVLQWQKDMQQEAWNREDNAVQRRVADLEAAGLSKTLAAGSGASSSSPIKLSAPQRQNIPNVVKNSMETMQAGQALMAQKAEIARTNANTKLINQQANNQRLSNQMLTQEFNFNRTANPQRLLLLAGQVEGIGLENAGRQLDNKISNLKITEQERKNALLLTQNLLAGQNVALRTQEVIAKALAIQASRHNIDLAKELQVFTSGATGKGTQNATVVNNAEAEQQNKVQQVLDSVYNGVRGILQDITPW